MNPNLQEMAQEIERAYSTAADLSLGWRLLYSPARTLVENTGVAIFGLNPGGSVLEPPKTSVEAGNAWLANVEPWQSRNTQLNCARFFRKVLAYHGVTEISGLLNASLTSNLVPFRTPSSKELPKWAFDWGVQFWTRNVAALSTQRLIIAIGNERTRSPYAGLGSAFQAAGWSMGESGSTPSGWGSLQVRRQTYTIGTQKVTVVGVPHFSRFETRSPESLKWISQLLPARALV